MSSNETQSTEQCSSNETVEMLPMELERRRCEAGNDGNTLYSENSISFSDKATEPRNLNLTIENRSLVIVQQSLTKQQQPNWEHTFLKRETKRVNGGEVQSDSAPKTKGSLLDQHKRPAELVACQLQTFGDTQQRSQTEWRDTLIASVDPHEKHGYLNGQECERMLKKLELLQDEGKFAEHERLVTACIRRFADEENPDMELALKMERGVASSYRKEFKNSKRWFIAVIKSGKTKKL